MLYLLDITNTNNRVKIVIQITPINFIVLTLFQFLLVQVAMWEESITKLTK